LNTSGIVAAVVPSTEVPSPLTIFRLEVHVGDRIDVRAVDSGEDVDDVVVVGMASI